MVHKKQFESAIRKSGQIHQIYWFNNYSERIPNQKRTLHVNP